MAGFAQSAASRAYGHLRRGANHGMLRSAKCSRQVKTRKIRFQWGTVCCATALCHTIPSRGIRLKYKTLLTNIHVQRASHAGIGLQDGVDKLIRREETRSKKCERPERLVNSFHVRSVTPSCTSEQQKNQNKRKSTIKHSINEL